MFQIISTNEVIHKTQRFNPRTGRSETICTVLPVGRVIAERSSAETVTKHCEKLRRYHPAVEFNVIEKVETER